MRPIRHASISLLLAGSGYLMTQSLPVALAAFGAGFLIDADHVIDYLSFWWRMGKDALSPKEFFQGDYIEDSGKVYIVLHSYELLLPLWLGSVLFYGLPLAFWVSLSFLAHIVMDHLDCRLPLRSYSLAFRASHGFKYHRVSGLAESRG